VTASEKGWLLVTLTDLDGFLSAAAERYGVSLIACVRGSGSARPVTKSRFTRTSMTNHSQFCISAATRARSGVSARPTGQMRSTGSTQGGVTGLTERTRTAHLTSRKERAPTLHCMFDHGFSPPRVR